MVLVGSPIWEEDDLTMSSKGQLVGNCFIIKQTNNRGLVLHMFHKRVAHPSESPTYPTKMPIEFGPLLQNLKPPSNHDGLSLPIPGRLL